MGTPVFPGSVKTFTTKQDGIDTVVAAHVNTLQDEVVALQSQVGVSSELPSLNLPSTSGTGAAVANRVSPQISGLKQWADHLNTYKAPLLSPTFTGTVTLPATTSIGPFDAGMMISSEELSYLNGVSSNIQSQLNGKVSSYGANAYIDLSATIGGSLTLGGQINHTGNFDICANGGSVRAYSNGSLTTIACAQGVYGNQAVTRSQLDYTWASALNSFLSPNEQFYGSLRTLDGTFYQMHTNASDKKSVINIEHANAVYATIDAVNSVMYGHVTTYPHTSSRDLKNDISALSLNEASELFAAIDPVSFTFKSVEEDPRVGINSGQYHLGFIAEDVRDAGVPVHEVVPVPQIDSPTDERVLALSLPDLVAVLWAKVKEQDQRISDLEGAQ